LALTQDEVVRTAVRLLDDIGLDALTLRRLAAELGVTAPTLYWHVKDKRALLDLVAVAIIEEDGPPIAPVRGQPWWEWLTEMAFAQYRAVVRHRDGARVLAGNRPTEQSLPAIDRTLGILIDVGFPAGEALAVLLTVGHFVMGAALEYQAEAARDRAGEHDAAMAVRIGALEEFPNLAAAARLRAMGPDPEAHFRYGLGLIVAGLRTRHEAIHAARPVSAVPARS
jgi:TetR/AcrR family tetracycline transcriptional repressor